MTDLDERSKKQVERDPQLVRDASLMQTMVDDPTLSIMLIRGKFKGEAATIICIASTATGKHAATRKKGDKLVVLPLGQIHSFTRDEMDLCEVSAADPSVTRTLPIEGIDA